MDGGTPEAKLYVLRLGLVQSGLASSDLESRQILKSMLNRKKNRQCQSLDHVPLLGKLEREHKPAEGLLGSERKMKTREYRREYRPQLQKTVSWQSSRILLFFFSILG